MRILSTQITTRNDASDRQKRFVRFVYETSRCLLKSDFLDRVVKKHRKSKGIK